MQCTEEPSTQTRLGDELLPIDFTGVPHRAGIVCGPSPHVTLAAENWVENTVREALNDPGRGDDVAWRSARIARELLDNAVAHTACGLPGGAIRLVLSRTACLLTVAVTDQGPRPNAKEMLLPVLRPDRNGLRRVDELSVYWDWDGASRPGRCLTVIAKIDLP